LQDTLSINKFKKLLFLYFPDILAIFVLLISGIIYVSKLREFLDILDLDESIYLHWGVSFPVGFPLPEWSPIYVLWYYLLNLLQSDIISLYFLNYALMTILPPIFIYMLLRVNKVQMIIAFTCSIFFLLSFSNFQTVPKVSHFALLTLLLGLIIATLIKDKKLKVLSLSITLLLTSFIRPEFFLSFLLVGVILSILYIKEFSNVRSLKVVVPLLSVAVLCIILLFVFGSPVGSGERSFVAFGQHYARNWVKWHNDPREPNANFRIILKEDFGNSSSVSEAILKNPSAIVKHMSQNISNMPKELDTMFLNFYPKSHPRKALLLLAFILFVISLIPFLPKGNKLNFKSFLKHLSENFNYFKFFFLTLLIAVVPLIFSIIFIFPRTHYLLLLFVIIIVMLISTLLRNAFNPEHKTIQLLIKLVYACLLPIILVRPLSSLIDDRSQENLLTIKYLRSAEIKEPVNILDVSWIYSIYQNQNYNRVPEYTTEVSFKEYLNKWSINMIILSKRILNDTRFSNDSECKHFINNPEEYGFIVVEIPEVRGIKLLVKEDIWKKSRKN